MSSTISIYCLTNMCGCFGWLTVAAENGRQRHLVTKVNAWYCLGHIVRFLLCWQSWSDVTSDKSLKKNIFFLIQIQDPIRPWKFWQKKWGLWKAPWFIIASFQGRSSLADLERLLWRQITSRPSQPPPQCHREDSKEIGRGCEISCHCFRY